MAHGGLARALAMQGRTDEAIAEFNAAQSLHTYSFSDMIDVGVYEQTHGKAQDAVAQYQRAAGASQDAKSRAIALSDLASAYVQMGDLSHAKMSYASALEQNPDYGAALLGSGLLAEREGDFAIAVARISHAVEMEPSDVGYLLLEQALRRAGRLAEADDARAHAQRISHDFAQAEHSASQVLVVAGVSPE
jgi:tetratricopeptide (TPR) repeat protein